ncbi:hypothetical protein AB0C29_41590 [Actinoplanes sp. NPDC048791]|uniref:hypothetical protein n=1 Tax=Actinoplanes sp. NPDC048791 TaxID=3154623 RepID=UPI0033F05B73
MPTSRPTEEQQATAAPAEAKPQHSPKPGAGSSTPVSPVPPATRPGPNPAANAAPIGRLITSGPSEPRKYADSDLGPTWFGAKPKAAQENAEEAKADGVVLNLDITGLMNGIAGATTTVSPEEVTAPDQPEPSDAQPTSGGPAPGEPSKLDEEAEALLVPGPEPTEIKPAAPGRPRPLGPEDLAAIRWRLDGATLREVVDDRDALRELGERLDGPLADEQDNVARAGLLSVRAEVYRLLDELGMAAAASRLALAHAESAGDVQALVIAQAELAHVLRLRGDYAEADRLFEQAASSEAPELLRSVVHENAGRSAFDQGRHMEALDHFARAVRLGLPDDQELAQRIEVSLEAIYIHVLRDGWGPYPRMRREILGLVKAGTPEQS